jgi:hypothetical protein
MGVSVGYGDGDGRGPGDGGAEVVIRLRPSEAGPWPHDLEISAEVVDTFFWAVGMLRGGLDERGVEPSPPRTGDWLRVLADLERLRGRIDGVRAAAVRAYSEAGGDAVRLGLALHRSPGDAEEFVRRVVRAEPGTMERWARARPAAVSPPPTTPPAPAPPAPSSPG